MPSNPLQACPIEKPYDLRQLKALDLGIGTRRVLFGPQIKACIEIQDEHIEIELAGHAGYVLAALRLSDSAGEGTRFLTVGDDRTIFIWNIHGEIQHELSGHTGRIGAVWELTGSRIATWGEDKSLRVWSTRDNDPTAIIPAKVRSPDRVFVAPSGYFFIVREWWSTRIVSHTGTELTTLPRIAEPITSAQRLDSGRWITQTAQGMKLWSNYGELQRAFSQPFSLEDGYLELPDGQLLVIDNAHSLTLFDRDGVLTGKRGDDEDMSRDLRRFVRCRKNVHEAIAARKTLQHFEHHKNPVGEPAVPPAAAAASDAVDLTLQQFFDRPDPKRIRTWRRDEIQASLHAREHVEDALHHHRVRRSLFWNAGLIAVGLFGIALAGALSSSDSREVRLALAAVVACFWLVVGLHFKGRTILAAENVLSALLPHTDALVSQIKAHRRRILDSLHSAETRRVYAGDETQRLIDQKIAGDLRTLAQQECGISENDLTPSDRQVVLRDWALLQFGRDADEEDAGAMTNLGSFWWTVNGSFVFGVQTVQYLFLTRERVHVFSMDYDFIAGRAGNKVANAFSYREVTSITARDVVRSAVRAGLSTNVDATEIVLQLKSGLRISFTALHAQGAHALRRAVKEKLGTTLAERQQNLQSEIMSWQRDSVCSDADRQLAITSLRDQLAAVEEAELTSAVQPDPSRRRIDETLAQLRSMILDYKAPFGSNIRSRRSSEVRSDDAGGRVISLDERRSASS